MEGTRDELVSRLSVKIFFLSTESFRRGTLLCLRQFQVSKIFMFKREISRFSIENFLSHSTNKLRNGTRLSFTKILVSRNFMNKRGGGVVSQSFV